MEFPPLAFSGTGRYDDPRGERSVLYAAMDRRAAFLETLDAFRPDLMAIADRDTMLVPDSGVETPYPSAMIPARFFTRQIIRFSVGANQHWLDARSPETHAVLQNELSQQISDSDRVSFWEICFRTTTR